MLKKDTGPRLNITTVSPDTCIGIPMLRIRQSWDRLIFNMGIPILVRQHLYIETAPWFLETTQQYGMYCLVHQGTGVRDKSRVSEIDLSQPRHETAFWWRHNGPVTSQSTDPIKWCNYPLQLIGIYVHINTHNKEYLTHGCRRSTNVQLCLIFLYIPIWFES